MEPKIESLFLDMEDRNITGIILAGGKSSRLGRDKSRETIGGVPLIRRVITAVGEVSREIIIVGGQHNELAEMGPNIRFVLDRAFGIGPLMGIYSGLSEARYACACLVACDLPFINPSVLRLLIDMAAGHQAAVTVIGGTPQPTHAIYAKSVLPIIEETLRIEGAGLMTLLDRLDVKYIEEAEVREIDPELLSFMNINTERDLKEARRIYETKLRI